MAALFAATTTTLYPLRFCGLLNLIRQFFHSVIYHNVNPIQRRCVNGGGYVIIASCWWIGYYIKQTLDDGELGNFIKENTYFASYPYEVFLYLKYQQNILRMCQRDRTRLLTWPVQSLTESWYKWSTVGYNFGVHRTWRVWEKTFNLLTLSSCSRLWTLSSNKYSRRL